MDFMLSDAGTFAMAPWNAERREKATASWTRALGARDWRRDAESRYEHARARPAMSMERMDRT
jgi:hypothetical protein